MAYPPLDDDDLPKKTHFWYFFPVPKSTTPLIKHQLTIIITVMSAGTILLPPRTMGRNALLGGATLFGIHQLRYDWTGKPWSHRTDPEVAVLKSVNCFSLPDGAKAAKDKIRQEKELKRIQGITEVEAKKVALASFIEKEKELKRIDGLMGDERSLALYMMRVKEAEEAEARGEGEEYGFWKKLWMGEEKAGWELRRWKEHREILERGEGLWGAIMHDVNDAWEMVVGKDEDDDDEDPKAQKRNGKKDETKKKSS